MEDDIVRWLNFAGRVESKLQTINSDNYSEIYVTEIYNLLNELRSAATNLTATSLIDNHEGYFKVNELAQKLRNTAYFAHHA